MISDWVLSYGSQTIHAPHWPFSLPCDLWFPWWNWYLSLEALNAFSYLLRLESPCMRASSSPLPRRCPVKSWSTRKLGLGFPRLCWGYVTWNWDRAWEALVISCRRGPTTSTGNVMPPAEAVWNTPSGARGLPFPGDWRNGWCLGRWGVTGDWRWLGYPLLRLISLEVKDRPSRRRLSHGPAVIHLSNQPYLHWWLHRGPWISGYGT